MSKKILLITGDAGESYETLYAKHRFEEAGYVAHIAAPSKRRLNLVIHSFAEGWDTYKESPGYEIAADMALNDVQVEDYLGCLLLGGRAPEYLRNSPRVISIVQQFHREKKWLFSICHGIQVLIAAGIVEGCTMTCYEHIRFEVESNGGTFIADRQAVRDGQIVTGQTWESHPEFYRLVFECLADSD